MTSVLAALQSKRALCDLSVSARKGSIWVGLDSGQARARAGLGSGFDEEASSALPGSTSWACSARLANEGVSDDAMLAALVAPV